MGGTAKYFRYHPAQGTIAKALGLRRETVNRALSLLKGLGLIDIERRDYDSCVYHPTHYIKNKKSRIRIFKLLAKLLTPVLGVISLCHINLHFSNLDQSNKGSMSYLVTPLGKKMYNKVSSSTDSKTHAQVPNNLLFLNKNKSQILLQLKSKHHLEDKQIAKLSIYTVQTIEFASSTKFSSFDELFARANDYSLEHYHPINWKNYYDRYPKTSNESFVRSFGSGQEIKQPPKSGEAKGSFSTHRSKKEIETIEKKNQRAINYYKSVVQPHLAKEDTFKATEKEPAHYFKERTLHNNVEPAMTMHNKKYEQRTYYKQENQSQEEEPVRPSRGARSIWTQEKVVIERDLEYHRFLRKFETLSEIEQFRVMEYGLGAANQKEHNELLNEGSCRVCNNTINIDF